MITLVSEKTDPKHGKALELRSCEELLKGGLILIDKPAGPASNQITVWVRKILNTKTAHVGTLDPQVTGVLPILLGKGAKILEYLQAGDKEYVCMMRLGKKADEGRLKEIFIEFTGKIYQKPPLYSAVAKHIRVRKIHSLELLETEDNLVLFRAAVQHGTYIRKLVDDIGFVLGTPSKMEDLRRTRATGFVESECTELIKLKDAYELYKQGDDKKLKGLLRPLEDAVRVFPKVIVRDSAINALCYGADLAVPGIAALDEGVQKNGVTALFSQKGELVGIGHAMFEGKEIATMKKGIAVDVEKTVMEKDTYPRVWKKTEIKK